MDNVYLYECNSYEDKEINEVIKKLVNSFSALKDIKKGTKVVIKANLVSAMSPDKNATTNPVLLKSLTSYLLSKECSVTIGDSPGGIYNKVYLNGIYKATKMNETGAHLNDDFGVKSTTYNDAKVLKTFDYTSYIDDADIKINFSKLKTHGMMGMSCAVKNLFGLIPGTTKPEYHYRFPNKELFANMLIDLNEYFKFDLNIVDAIYGMEGNGPTMGDSRFVGLVLASERPYALDYTCSKLINIPEENVETIIQSEKRKLFNKDKIKYNIDYSSYIVKDYKSVQNLNSLRFYNNKKDIFSKLISLGSNMIFENKPNVIKKKCIGCGKCASICPAKAITMVNKKPSIDRKKCIKCYCCQEFCPVGAMIVKSSLLAKSLHNKKK